LECPCLQSTSCMWPRGPFLSLYLSTSSNLLRLSSHSYARSSELSRAADKISFDLPKFVALARRLVGLVKLAVIVTENGLFQFEVCSLVFYSLVLMCGSPSSVASVTLPASSFTSHLSARHPISPVCALQVVNYAKNFVIQSVQFIVVVGVVFQNLDRLQVCSPSFLSLVLSLSLSLSLSLPLSLSRSLALVLAVVPCSHPSCSFAALANSGQLH
jgi:hypothetical protein